MPVTDQEIRETYLRYFRELNGSVTAGLQTASFLAPEGPERHAVWNRIRQMIEPIELSIGDPYRLAIQAAIDKLEAEGAPTRMREAWTQAAEKASAKMSVKEWDPNAVEARIEHSRLRPWLVVDFDAAGVLTRWDVVRDPDLGKKMPAFPSAAAHVWPAFSIKRDTTVESFKPVLQELLRFVRTRYQRGRARESGVPTAAIYPHELVASLLPPRAEYIVRWSIPEDWARAATEVIFALPGVKDLEKEIESDHATLRVPDLVFLNQALTKLAEMNLVSKHLLGDDLLQVSTEFWDIERRRWVSVSEVVSAFDQIEPRR